MADSPHAARDDGSADSSSGATKSDREAAHDHDGPVDLVGPWPAPADVGKHRGEVLTIVEHYGQDTSQVAQELEKAPRMRIPARVERGEANPAAFVRHRQKAATEAFTAVLYAEAHELPDTAKMISRALRTYEAALEDAGTPEQVREVQKAKREIVGLAEQPEIASWLKTHPGLSAADRVESARLEVQRAFPPNDRSTPPSFEGGLAGVMNAGRDEQKAAASYKEATDALRNRSLPDLLAVRQHLIDSARLGAAWSDHHARQGTDEGRRAALDFGARAARRFENARLVGLAADVHDRMEEVAANLGDDKAADAHRQEAARLRRGPGAG